MKTRTWFRVHSWTGVITGLLMFVTCWSGTMATLSREIDWLLTPELRVEPRGTPLPLEALHAAARHAYPITEIGWLSATPDANTAAEVSVEDATGSRRVLVDPYTGEVLAVFSGFSVQRFFRSFHMNLFSGTVGKYTVFTLGAVLMVSLVTPLVFYKRWWTRFFALKTGKGARALWSDLHKLTGLWGWWFVLVIALTGAWYLWEGLRNDVVDGKGAWAAPGNYAVLRLPDAPLVGAPLPFAELLLLARQARPDIEVRSAAMERGYFYLDGQSEHWLVRDRANKIYLDPRDGSVIFNQYASDQPLYWRLSDTADPLHFGDFGGLTSKLIWFVFGLGLSGVCLTGAWLHAQRLAQEAGGRRRARWPGTFAAIVATLVLLAASVRGGWQEIKGYGPKIDGIQHWPEVPWPVTAFIAAWVGLTLAVIGWWVWMQWRPQRPASAPAASSDYAETIPPAGPNGSRQFSPSKRA